MSDLLGGAIRGKTRPRGFVDWKPQAATLRAAQIRFAACSANTADYLPLTVRQVFYRLVGAHGYDKTERAYERPHPKRLNRRAARAAHPYGGDPGRRRYAGRSATFGATPISS